MLRTGGKMNRKERRDHKETPQFPRFLRSLCSLRFILQPALRMTKGWPGRRCYRKYAAAPRLGTQVVRRRLLLRLYSRFGPSLSIGRKGISL